MAQLMAYDANPNMNWDVVKTLGHDVKTFTDSGAVLDYAEYQVDTALLGDPEGIE